MGAPAEITCSEVWSRAYDNEDLRHIDGFREVRRINRGLVLTGNYRLRHITGFGRLTQVGALSISTCELQSLSAFRRLREVDGRLSLVRLHRLESMEGLAGVRVSGRLELSVLPVSRRAAERFSRRSVANEAVDVVIEGMARR